MWLKGPSCEPGKAVGQGDTYALVALTFFLGALCSRQLIQGATIQSGATAPDQEEMPWSECNIVLIGGPVSNKASHILLSEPSLKLLYLFRSVESSNVIDLLRLEEWFPLPWHQLLDGTRTGACGWKEEDAAFGLYLMKPLAQF